MPRAAFGACLRAVILAGCLGSCLPFLSAESEEAAHLAAAAESLEAGLPEQALRLLAGLSDTPQRRFLRAQSVAGIEGPQAALDSLGWPQPPPDWDAAQAWLAAWPSTLQVAVGRQMGDWAHRAQRPDARWWWTLALDSAPGPEDTNHLLLAVAESAAIDGAWMVVRSSSETLWARRAPWELRARAGELLGLAKLRKDLEAGIDFLLALLAHPRLESAAQQRLTLTISEVAWRDRPGAVLQIVARARSLQPSSASSPQLDLYQALALSRLDPDAGARALRALLAEGRRHPALAQQLAEVEAQGDRERSAEERLAAAEASLLLGDAQRAEQLLGNLHRSDEVAFALWLRLPNRPLAEAQAMPVARRPVGAFALARALAREGDRVTAWRVLRPLLAQPAADSALELERLWWGMALAADQAPSERPALLERARAQAQRHPAVGQAWAEWAQGLPLGSHEQGAAWAQALRWLPPDASWAPIALRQALAHQLAARRAWEVAAQPDESLQQMIVQAQAVLQERELNDQHLQAGAWLLAQALVQQGDIAAALGWLARLAERADPERRQRIEGIRQRLKAQSVSADGIMKGG
ncbi:MAG: hypothetical protein EA402_08625 [Planctomycetota bacterium]|nr:MAG: hypothetical protein EA402_08625 [Planctomycetota bacterium]